VLFIILMQAEAQGFFEAGLNAFKKKDYRSAEQFFKKVIYSLPPNDYTDKAQYYLALLYYEKKDYELAKGEIEFFVNNFRYSNYYPDGLILLAKIYYKISPNAHRDISELSRATEILKKVKVLYPDYEKKADSVLYMVRTKFSQKVLISADVYRKLKRYKAEAIYLEYYLSNFEDIKPDSVALRLMEIYEMDGNKEKFLSICDRIISSDYYSNWLKKIALEKREKYGYRNNRG
jgi:outer membrane protein assembly factor BamD